MLRSTTAFAAVALATSLAGCVSPIDRLEASSRLEESIRTIWIDRAAPGGPRAVASPASHPEAPVATELPVIDEHASVEACLVYAALASPELEAAYYTWQAARERVPQVTALPDPRISYGYFVSEVETRVGPQEHRLGVSQMFPWFGRLDLAGNEAARAADAAWERFQAARLALLSRVETAYAELFHLRAAIEITRENVELFRQLEEIARARYAVATQSHPEVIRLQVELGELGDRLARLEQLRAPLTARLNAALDRANAAPAPWPATIDDRRVPLDEAALTAALGQRNPELLALARETERERERTKLARLAAYPDITLSLDTTITGDAANPSMPESGDDPLIAGVSINLPIWREKYDAGIRESLKRRMATSAARHAATNRLEAELSHSIFLYLDAGRRMELYRGSLVPKARESLNASLVGYQGATTSFIDLLDTERTLLELQLAERRATADLAIARSAIELLVGERLGAWGGNAMTIMRRLLDVLLFVWRSIAAVVALALIVAAFVVGWQIGHGDEAPPDPTTEGAPVATAAAPTLYTCSMHPQVRLPDPKAKCPICFMDLIPVVEGDDDGDGPPRLVMTDAAKKLAEVQTARVARFYPERTVRLFGRVDYDETLLTTISAYFPGRLERLYVDYTGVTVRRGDHLAEIYSPDLLAAQAELRLASASAAAAAGASETMRGATTALRNAAREKLRLWGLTDEQIASIERSDEVLDQLTIYSPMTGVVIERKAVKGMYVKTGEPIYVVADLDHLWVRLEAYESQLPWIRYGQPVEFTVESMPGARFTSRISFIEPVVDPRTRTVAVRLNIDNTDRRLKPGMFARAIVRSRIAGYGQVIVDELAGKWISPMHPEIVKDGPGTCDICGMDLVPVEELGYRTMDGAAEPPLVVPASAVLVTGARAVVYVQVPDAERPTFEGREIVPGPRAGDYYIVLDGLREGEDVVVNGAFKIDSSMQLAAKSSMMSPPATTQPADDRIAVPDGFVFSLKPLYAAYFDMQEGLAADDLTAYRRAAGDLDAALEIVDVAGVVGEPLGVWRRIKGRLASADVTDIDAARVRFDTQSRAIIELQERFGHRGRQAHHVVHCPMAFDNRGADWLARIDGVANPYFGASMLRCGTVKRSIPSIDAAEVSR